MSHSRRLAAFLIAAGFTLLPSCDTTDNPVAQAPERRNDQLSLDGVNDWASAPASGKLGLNGQLTVEAWIKLSQNVSGGQGRIINRQATEGGLESWGLEIFGNGYGGSTGNEVVFHANNCATAKNLRSGINLQPGIWYHVAAVSDGATLRLYVDDRSAAQAEALGMPCDPASVPLVVGRTGPGTGPLFYFPGEIDELRVWSTVRSADEIERNAEGVDPRSPDLVAYWTFDDPLAAVQPDRTGHGYDLHLSR